MKGLFRNLRSAPSLHPKRLISHKRKYLQICGYYISQHSKWQMSHKKKEQVFFYHFTCSIANICKYWALISTGTRNGKYHIRRRKKCLLSFHLLQCSPRLLLHLFTDNSKRIYKIRNANTNRERSKKCEKKDEEEEKGQFY